MKKLIITIMVCFLFTFIVGCNSLNNQYTITFNSNGGTVVSSITENYNKQVTKPTDPTKTGYTFGGWYSDSDFTTVYDFTTIPKENITLYAKWLSTEGLIYTLLGNNTYLVSYRGSYPYLLIPREYNGCLVTEIGYLALIGETSLRSITIPNSVTKIDSNAFYRTTSLTNINVDVDNSQYSSKDGVLFNKNQTLIISYPANKVEAVYIIPNSVTTIASSAFNDSKNLKTVIFEEGSQLTTISNIAFYKATSISTVIFEEGSQLTTIGHGAFSGATSLTSITIPNSVTTIGDFAFFGATSLTSINVDVDNPQYSSINGILFNKNQTIIISYPASKEEVIYTIPNSVITITDRAFYRATSLTNITIPDSVTTIGDFAFEGATSLTSITIPDSVTTIGDFAFEGATSLASINVDVDNPRYSSKDGVLLSKNQTKIILCPSGKTGTTYTIPNSVTTIGSYAFEGATNLTSITIYSATPPSIEKNLGVLDSNFKIYVASDYVSIYKTAWPDYASIIYPIQ